LKKTIWSAVATPFYPLNLIIDDRQHNANQLLEKYTNKKNNYLVSGLKMYNHQKYWGLILKSSLLILFVIMRSNFLDNTITDSLCNMILPRVVALVSSIDISASLTARFNGWLSLVAAAFRVQLQRS